MERKQIAALLQKYYDGMSKKQEERDLLEFFTGTDVPDEFDIDRKHFLAMADMQNEEIEVPADLEASIFARLAVEQKPVRRLNARMLYTITSVAAGLALIVSTFMFINRQPNLGTYDDPQLAYAETKEALEMVSQMFNRGTEKLAGLGEMDKAMQALSTFGKFGEGMDRTMGLLND